MQPPNGPGQHRQSGGGQPPGEPSHNQPTGKVPSATAPPRTGGASQQQPVPPGEMTVATPTLRWVTLTHPQEFVPLGPDDHVLDSVYHSQTGRWDVLVIVQPGEESASDADEAE